MNEAGYVAPRALNISRQAIEAHAEKVRRQLGYQPGQDLVTLVNRLGGKISIRNLWNHTPEDGSIIIRGAGEFEIVLSDATSPRRDRFTIAHELGHYFLHFASQLSEVGDGRPMVAQRFATGRAETEAHWFAAQFLMPEVEFRSSWQEFGGHEGAVAMRFQVSLQAASVRAQALNLQ
ncbi:MAG TPA: ImmA/IrrE family metallo-endopeptidase [Polyangia bacterium]|jgi:predicted transcriptional regulator